ncbi:MAG: right-handed parallel beta-helix repeat-containing protein, partial [Methanothrix sp.]|nr:right-handed parallel beta-helix repeat-containing protein [Methanothrix sp.]
QVLDNGAGTLLDFSGGNALWDNRIDNSSCNFNVNGSGYEDFDNNISSNNLLNGRPLYYLFNVSDIIINSTSRAGSVFGLYCSNLTIENLDLMENYQGIYLRNTTGSRVVGNRLAGNTYGLSLFGCENNRLENNTAIESQFGYSLILSERNMLLGNRALDSALYGIYLQGSDQNILKYNLMEGCRYGLAADRENDIDITNRINGRPAYFLVNESDRVLDGSYSAGTIFCFNCKNITIRDQNISAGCYGISLFNSTDSMIEKNYLSHNRQGIFLDNSSQNTLLANQMVENDESGIELSHSPQNTLIENQAAANQNGISIFSSRDNDLAFNLLSLNREKGIWLNGSHECSLTNNSAYKNGYGIILESSGGCRLFNSSLSSNQYNFALLAEERAHMLHFIGPDNLADGKPILYLIGSTGRVIGKKDDAGAVYCIDCSNIAVQDQEISNSHCGICLYNTSQSHVLSSSISECEKGVLLIDSKDNLVNENHLQKNGFGVYLKHSLSNLISQNTISESLEDGIKLFESDGNLIWNNEVESSQLSGIHLDPSNSNNVTSNVISDNAESNVNRGPGSESNNLRDNGMAAASSSVGAKAGDGEDRDASAGVESIDYSSLVEEEKSKLCMGNIAFEPEREMIVGEVYRVEVRISINETMQDLIAGLSSQGEVKVECLPVSTFMKVRLTGPKFEISPITDERQLVAKSGYREWLWDVTPIEPGRHDLTLSAFAEIILPGQQPMTIDSRVFSSHIQVMAKEEPVAEKTEGFIKKNWQFIVGTLIMGSGLLKWILGKIKAKSGKARKREEKQEQNKKEENNQKETEEAAKKQ